MRSLCTWGCSATLLAALLAGCEGVSPGGGALYLAAVHPAEASLPGDVKTIAVTPFVGQGPYGRANAETASGMLAAKLNQTVGSMGSGQYTIVDRSNLKQLLMEVDLGEAGISDPAAASKAGKILNADAVVFGTVNVTQSEQQGTKTELNPVGLLSNSGPKTKTVRTVRRTCTVSMNFQMCRPSTSEVLLSKPASHNYDSGSESTNKGLFGSEESASMDQVVRVLTEQCVDDFYGMISPHVEVYELQMAGGRGAQAKSARALALGGEYAEAVKQFDGAFTADPADHGSLYNRGLTKLMLGDAAGGKADIVRASTIKSDKKYAAAIAAVNQALAGNGQVSIRAATPQEITEHQQSAKLAKKKKKLGAF